MLSKEKGGLLLYKIYMETYSEADTRFPERRGVGCYGYGYFILGYFVEGHVTWCMDKMSADKIQNVSPNCKGEQNAGPFMRQEGQNTKLIKTLYI